MVNFNFRILMAKKYFLNSEGTQQFSNALDLLNQSIMEFNLVADKMVPEQLLTMGLTGYLKDFCSVLQEESKIQFQINSMDEPLNLIEEMEIDLFRCVRNILLMLVRNSNITNASLEIAGKPKLVQLTIQHNGPDIFRYPSAIIKTGLDNVSAILSTMGGIMDIQANYIEIQVPVNF